MTRCLTVLFACSTLFLASGPVRANSEATDIVTEAYQDVLGRKPDDKGLRQYRSKVIEDDWTAEDIRKDLRKSNEYMDKVIKEAFMDVLGRKPEDSALQNYRHKMRDKGWSEKDVRNELRKSDEYKSKNK